ncbi:hypothetical protein K458DRAFT_391291 [Lentithecium fluviatile CBS 122367]|uniref:Uncharacterized protein n=1 Tax=Lentithecium fluviatile CBS 122367 TaxID=1168545 RepID=A0A6G1IVI8_9PLEO|nr:hypothetical protein K458DRAFT_391291 [Lentithecium fluviatile CBS 122367]
MTDRDPLVDAFPHVKLSRFSSIDWPDWPEAVYDRLNREKLVTFLMGGIFYVVECLRWGPVRTKLGLNSNLFINHWDPVFFDDQFEELVKGNQSMLATYHAGAQHAIEKLREDMSEEVKEEGLGECVDALEKGVHKQFVMRIVGMAKKVKQMEEMGFADEVKRIMEGKEDGNGGEGRIMEVVEDDGAEDQEDGFKSGMEKEEEDEFNPPEKESGRARNRIKSKKAKKAVKKGKRMSSNPGNKRAQGWTHIAGIPDACNNCKNIPSGNSISNAWDLRNDLEAGKKVAALCSERKVVGLVEVEVGRRLWSTHTGAILVFPLPFSVVVVVVVVVLVTTAWAGKDGGCQKWCKKGPDAHGRGREINE